MIKVILKVKRENLLEWYFNDWDRDELYIFLKTVKKDMILSGEYILRIEEIVDMLGYIPSHILEGEHDVDEYETWDELVVI